MANFGDYHAANFAGWSVYWRIPAQSGGGLEVWWADFLGHRVMWRGSQPFALVPYHGGSPTYKDGYDAHCGGAPFFALKHGAPNGDLPYDPGPFDAAVDTDAVVVATDAADDFGPARLTISAKFQCGWYQYVHRWEFSGDGVITPSVAMGGHVNPYAPDTAHVHHMYFRVDLDIDGQYPHDVCEEFDHKDFTPGGDHWTTLNAQGKRFTNPDTARKWRVRDTVVQNKGKQWKGYEIELPRTAGRDQYSTGDLWATIYRGDDVQQGEGVGLMCTDEELETKYATGPLHPATGDDIVLWLVVRHHHEPRFSGEEFSRLPYHFHEFSITPQNFLDPGSDNPTGAGGRPPR
jgi:hypothetical protein